MTQKTDTFNPETLSASPEEHKESKLAYLQRMLGVSPVGVVLVLVLAVLPFVPPFNREDLLRWMIGATLIAAQAIAFDFTTGYINVVNFGFAAFLGVGAYTSALLAVEMGVSPWIGMFAGAIPAAILGFFTGILTLRLRGIFAALMSWFVGLALLGIARNWVDLTRGPLGLSAPTFLETASNRPYFYIIFSMMIATYVILRWITRSHIGLAFRAIGQNLDAAQASGVNPTFYRVLNFTVQCAFAGWFGGFYAHYYGILTPQIMATSHTVEVLAIAYVGGRGSIWGGAFVAFPFIFFFEWLRSNLTEMPGLHLVIYGVLLILVMIFYPGGVAQLYQLIRGLLSKARGKPSPAQTS
jgi:branched-chain amino acid transport system permease protein